MLWDTTLAHVQGGGDAVLSSPNAHVMARQASQQHSVRRPANQPAAAAAGSGQQPPLAPADAAVPTAAALFEEQQVLQSVWSQWTMLG